MQQPRSIGKTLVVVGINIPIALLHFVTGPGYRGPFPGFVNGHMLNILIPLGFYFLLCLNEYSILRHSLVKGGLMFAVGSGVEIAQYFGVPLLGRTFDPWDFFMYGLQFFKIIPLHSQLFSRDPQSFRKIRA